MQTPLRLFNSDDGKDFFPFQLNSGDLASLAIESLQLAQILATEERDLAAIRSNHELRAKFLDQTHEKAMRELDVLMSRQSQIISVIEATAQTLIQAGEYQIAKQLMERLIVLLASGGADLNG